MAQKTKKPTYSELERKYKSANFDRWFCLIVVVVLIAILTLIIIQRDNLQSQNTALQNQIGNVTVEIRGENLLFNNGSIWSAYNYYNGTWYKDGITLRKYCEIKFGVNSTTIYDNHFTSIFNRTLNSSEIGYLNCEGLSNG